MSTRTKSMEENMSQQELLQRRPYLQVVVLGHDGPFHVLFPQEEPSEDLKDKYLMSEFNIIIRMPARKTGLLAKKQRSLVASIVRKTWDASEKYFRHD